MRIMTARLAILCALLAALAACGSKGPLVLPTDAPAPTEEPAKAEQPAQ